MRLRDPAALCVLLASLVGCPPGSDDDDSAPVANDDDATSDDDDSTPVDPLADVLGIFNATNVVRSDGTSYIDLSGAFGTFAAAELQPFGPAGYLQTFSFGADAPFWRFDLGGFPLPAEGAWEVVTPSLWQTWLPADETWWDAGSRVGVGNYLAQRLDFEDVSAYQVDDPLVPGAAAWTPGAALSWDNAGGDVIAWSAPNAVPLPDAAALLEPAEGSSVEVPAALPWTVRWTPGTDGSFVTLALIRDRTEPMWIAHVADTGEYTIPPDVLHDELGPGVATLVFGRTLETSLAHPQGAILVRSREERRATVDLLGDVQLDPPFAIPGTSLTVTADWWTVDWAAGATADFGEGITVVSVTPDPTLPQRASIELDVAADAVLAGRDVSLTSGSDSISLPQAFSVLNLLPADTCDDAGGPLDDGAHVSTTTGGTNTLRAYDCIPWSLSGPESVYAIDLIAGETLHVEVEGPAPLDAALVLLSDCGDASSSLVCADDGFEGDNESILYTSDVAQTVYLVVDGYFFTDDELNSFGGPYVLFVNRESQVLDPLWMLAGETKSFTLTGPQAWSTVGAADVSFGEGIVVEGVSPGIDPLDLAILATASPGADAGPRDLEVEDPTHGTVSFPGALVVTDWPAFDTCDAAVGDSVVAGAGTMYAPVGSSLDTVDCLDFDSLGPDVLLPVDLAAGETLTATATGFDDLQVYLMTDCADATACVVGVDDTVEGDAEVLTFEATAAGRYYLVIDVFDALVDPLGPLVFDLDLTIE